MTTELSERFEWQPGDLVVTGAVWKRTYEMNGGTYLVDDYESLIEYLVQSTQGESMNQAELLSSFVKTLTSLEVREMPLQLRQDLLDAGYTLP